MWRGSLLALGVLGLMSGGLGFAQDIFPGEPISDCAQCPEMVVVPAGSFLMGSPDSEPQRLEREGPQHVVTIRQPFAIGKYEVTFDEWDACVAARACKDQVLRDRGWGRGRRPVILISWNEAQTYAAWLSSVTGKHYRLPSESEWEYAARAGTTTAFYTGSTISTKQANFNGSGSDSGEYRMQTLPVGTFPPNAFGLHDIHGNVEEYTEDCWNPNFDTLQRDGSAWLEANCERRTQRDGDWKHKSGNARSAMRYWVHPDYGRDTFGLRIARDIEP